MFQPMVCTAIRIPFEQWERLTQLATARDYKRGDKPNLSEAARDVIDAGLAALEAGGNNREVKHDATT